MSDTLTVRISQNDTIPTTDSLPKPNHEVLAEPTEQSDSVVQVKDTLPVVETRVVPTVVKKTPKKKSIPKAEPTVQEIEKVDHWPVDLSNKFYQKKDSHTIIDIPNIQLSEQSSVHQTNQNEILFQKRERVLENNWILGFFILLSGAAIWLRLFNSKYLVLFFRALFNYQIGNKLYRDHNSVISKISLVLNLIFVLGFAFYLNLISIKYPVFDFYPHTGINYLIILLFTFSFVLFRYLILKFIGFVFRCEEVTNEYIYQLMLVYKTAGVVLLPLIISIYYIPGLVSDILLFVGILIVSVLLFIRVLKGVRLILRSNIFLSYIVLYLCTLEILPLLVVAKSIVNASVLSS